MPQKTLNRRKECVKENGVELITAEHMQIINDKRAAEKAKKKKK